MFALGPKKRPNLPYLADLVDCLCAHTKKRQNMPESSNSMVKTDLVDLDSANMSIHC